MQYKEGDILCSKILRKEEVYGTYHVLGYMPVSAIPVPEEIEHLEVLIWHYPVAGFSDATFITNIPVKKDELKGYLVYLKMTNFHQYLDESGENGEELAGLANEAFTKAYHLTDEKKYEEAIEKYTEAFEHFPLFFEALDNRAFVKMDLGRWEDAIEDFRLSLHVNPDSILAEFSIGECFLKMKEYEQAKIQFEKALQIDPDDKLAQEFLEKVKVLISSEK